MSEYWGPNDNERTDALKDIADLRADNDRLSGALVEQGIMAGKVILELGELREIAQRVITFVRCRKEEGLNCCHCKARREMRLWLEAKEMTAKPMSDEELEAIRKRRIHPESRMQDGRDIDSLIAEIERLRTELDLAHESIDSACEDGNRNADIGIRFEKEVIRLRHLDKLAREWLMAADVHGAPEDECREAYRAAVEKDGE